MIVEQVTVIREYFLEVRFGDNECVDFRGRPGNWERRYGESWEPEYGENDITNYLDTYIQHYFKE